MLFFQILFASYPKIYASLGDKLYGNAQNIETLKNFSFFEGFTPRIEKYLEDIAKTKDYGFGVELAQDGFDKKEYLKQLRELAKENDYFVNIVESAFKSAILQNNSELFYQVINSGLLDIEENKESIKSYYIEHMSEVATEGVIEMLLEEDKALAKRKRDEKKHPRVINESQREKIERIRQKDKESYEALRATLEEEARLKKQKIRETQKQELTH